MAGPMGDSDRVLPREVFSDIFTRKELNVSNEARMNLAIFMRRPVSLGLVFLCAVCKLALCVDD
jgi:hypothetical protein